VVNNKGNSSNGAPTGSKHAQALFKLPLNWTVQLLGNKNLAWQAGTQLLPPLLVLQVGLPDMWRACSAWQLQSGVGFA
jgi:hypothetical protein